MTPTPEPIARWRWGIVWLLFLATLINYVDRQALANTQGAMLAEFIPLNPGDDPEAVERARNQLYGRVNFAFGISFALFQILAGVLIDRFSLRWLYVGAIVLWSVAGILTGFVPAGAVALLMVCRFTLGVGEAFNWPCAVACVRRVIPRESRGLANGIFHSGASLGAMATPLVVLLLVANDGSGWRNVFVVVGSIGAAWAILWALTTRGEWGREIDGQVGSGSEDRPHPPAPSPRGRGGVQSPLSSGEGGLGGEGGSRERGEGDSDKGSFQSFWPVLRLQVFWISLVSLVSVNVCWHFYNQWLPRYLTQEMKYDLHHQQWLLAGFYVSADLGAMFSGWCTRKLARSGKSVERSRQLVMTALAAIIILATIPAAFSPVDQPWLKFPLFYVVAASALGGFAISFALVQDVSPRNTALVLGVCGCASWMVISVLGLGVGEVAKPGNYAWLFMAVGCVPTVAAGVGWLWPRMPGGGSAVSEG